MNLISHRFVRVLWLIVAWAYLLLVLAADLVVWPGSNISILYALPILIAAVYESPLYVNVVGTLTLVLAIVSLIIGETPKIIWPATLLGLAGVIYLSNILAYHSQESREYRKKRDSILNAAQELRQLMTVILGYTQVLYARPELERPTRDRILIRIEDAAHRANQEVADLLRALS